MAHIHSIAAAPDRVLASLVAGLELEFGRGAGEALARRFLEAEEGDFLWDARKKERWLGAYEAGFDEEIELDRVAILGRIQGCWFVAVSIVDGNGNPHGLIARRNFKSRCAAFRAFMIAH